MLPRSSALILPAFLPLMLAACGGGGSAPSPTPNPNPGSGIQTRLAACPVVNQSSDPAASSCLAGSYTGKTLSGTDCTLTVRTDGGYTYASAALNTSFTPTAQTIRVFGHMNVQGARQIVWLISDPISVAETHDLDFTARWGNTMPNTLEMQVTKRNGNSSLSSTCTLNL